MCRGCVVPPDKNVWMPTNTVDGIVTGDNLGVQQLLFETTTVSQPQPWPRGRAVVTPSIQYAVV